jgi:molybdopterin/thiamine biosynthesis adenylyltransferase
MTEDDRHFSSLDILPPAVKSRTIKIVGAGAIGGTLALVLAKMGFVNVLVYDHDKVECHNIDNQIYGPAHIGHTKVDAIEDICLELADLEIYGIEHQVGISTAKSALSLNSIVVVAVDSMSARKLIWEGLKEWKFGWLIDPRMGAEQLQIYTVNPNLFPEHARYESLLFEDKDAVQEPCTAKTIMYTPFIAAGLVAHQIKRLVMNQPVKQAITLDIPSLTFFFGG